jgi:UTP--glucose-1-phosphate uridylyltransferase
MRPVRKAVFPVAGLGTRFLPATKAMPKEMLPVIDKPLIQYAVEEAVAAGITDLIFVTGRNKRAIEDHFDSTPEMEAELARKGKAELLAIVQGILPSHVSCIYIRQSAPLGLGHAVLTAAPIVGDEPFAVLLADDLLDADRPVIGQLIDAALTYQGSILGVQEVPLNETDKYGIVATDPVSARTERDAQSCHFGKTTRDQRRTRIETQTEAVADACCNGNDVLHRAADFGTNDVIMRIHAQRRAVQRLRRRRSKRGVL